MIQELRESDYAFLVPHDDYSVIPCWLKQKNKITQKTPVIVGKRIGDEFIEITSTLTKYIGLKTGLYLGYFRDDSLIQTFYFDEEKEVGFSKVVRMKNNKPILRPYYTPDYIMPFRYYLLNEIDDI